MLEQYREKTTWNFSFWIIIILSFSSFLLFFVLLLFEIIFFFFFFSEFCSWLAFSVCVVWQSVREWHPKLYPNLRQWQHKLVLNATFVLDQSHLKPDIFPIPKEILQMANPANKVIKFCRKRVSTSGLLLLLHTTYV